jgi:hypothetical protein
MNLKFLSKTFGTIGLIAALSTVIGTVVQPAVQAQIEDIEVPTDIDEAACVASGFYSFYLLQNIDLSSAQLEELYKIMSAESDALEQLIESYPEEKDFSSLQFIGRPGVERSPEISAAIDAATLELTLTADTATETLAALNEEFGQYGEFGIGGKIIFTEARKAEMEQLEDSFDAQSVTVLTPEQQRQYQENLATKSRINEVCGIVEYDPATGTSTSFEPTTF